MGAEHFGVLCAEMQAENLFVKRNKRREPICSKKKDKRVREGERENPPLVFTVMRPKCLHTLGSK